MRTDPASTDAVLVLSEIPDGTRLAALGDALAEALWAQHDALLGELARLAGGDAVGRSHGALAWFADRRSALRFATTYVERLARLSPRWEARVAVHHGTLVVRANAPQHVARGAKAIEVDGLAVAVAARVASIAAPGQILITADAVPDGTAVTSHGWWRLKGAPEPVELFELRERAVTPLDGGKVYRVVQDGGAFRPASEVPHALPAEWDAFVGREAELRALAEAVETSRLVRVMGIGGIGKTRLVLRYAWLHRGERPGGVWYCDLDGVDDVEGHMARTLGPGPGGGDVASALRARGHCLVVLDHVAGGSWLGDWVAAAPEARFVVATREALDPGAPFALGPLTEADAVALFEERSRAAGAGFAGPREVVVELVDRLDRLPLAIELAAARARVLPPRRLIERLDEAFRLLHARQVRVERHASLVHCLDASFDPLSDDERAQVTSLAGFEGRISVPDAHRAWQIPIEEADRRLRWLAARSWLRATPDGDYELLAIARAYAARRAAEAVRRS